MCQNVLNTTVKTFQNIGCSGGKGRNPLFQTTDVIYLQKIKCQYTKLYLKTTIALEYIPDKCQKN